MARAQETYGKKEREKKRLKKREEKAKRKAERQANSNVGASFEDQLVYVDENGHFTDTPPDPTKKVKVDAESIVLGIPKKEEQEPEDPIRKGKVSFFDTSKGFGFIIDSENNESGLNDEIAENDNVSFELEKGMKGMNAVRVNKV